MASTSKTWSWLDFLKNVYTKYDEIKSDIDNLLGNVEISAAELKAAQSIIS